MKDKLVVVIGPTAVGKSTLSVALAKALNGEIISGDAMQVYRRLDIGTAKITKNEMDGIPHHLIDVKEPTETYTVAEFKQEAERLIKQINQQEKLPIITGGTGLYIQSVLFNYQFSEVTSLPEFREKMEKLALEKGNRFLHEKLKQVDPASYELIHPNNLRRIIRALEIYEATGVKMSQQQKQQLEDSPFDYVLIGLNMDRKLLYERINHRVDQMVESGLIAEVKQLYDAGIRNCQSVQAIGYKEIFPYLEGSSTLEAAIEQLKQNSRRYAKRQLTWFRNQLDVTWFDVTPGDFDKMTEEILYFIAGKLDKKAK